VTRSLTEHLQEIEVCENEVLLFQSLNPSIRVVIGIVSKLDTQEKVVILKGTSNLISLVDNIVLIFTYIYI
jgi:hypothetical protein